MFWLHKILQSHQSGEIAHGSFFSSIEFHAFPCFWGLDNNNNSIVNQNKDHSYTTIFYGTCV